MIAVAVLREVAGKRRHYHQETARPCLASGRGHLLITSVWDLFVGRGRTFSQPPWMMTYGGDVRAATSSEEHRQSVSSDGASSARVRRPIV